MLKRYVSRFNGKSKEQFKEGYSDLIDNIFQLFSLYPNEQEAIVKLSEAIDIAVSNTFKTYDMKREFILQSLIEKLLMRKNKNNGTI